MEWRGNLVKLGHAALQSMAEKSCVCVCVCVFLLQIQTPRYKHLFASVTLHPQTKAISFFFNRGIVDLPYYISFRHMT